MAFFSFFFFIYQATNQTIFSAMMTKGIKWVKPFIALEYDDGLDYLNKHIQYSYFQNMNVKNRDIVL